MRLAKKDKNAVKAFVPWIENKWEELLAQEDLNWRLDSQRNIFKKEGLSQKSGEWYYKEPFLDVDIRVEKNHLEKEQLLPEQIIITLFALLAVSTPNISRTTLTPTFCAFHCLH